MSSDGERHHLLEYAQSHGVLETDKYCTALRLYTSPTSLKIAISMKKYCELVV